MSQKKVLILHGSPSTESRSSRLADAVGARLGNRGVEIVRRDLRDFDAEALLTAQASDPKLVDLVAHARSADALVLSTPVYKATFSGSLKVIVDSIPPDALVGKSSWAVATARQNPHLEATGRALDALFDFFRIGERVSPLLLNDEVVFADAEKRAFSEEVERLLDERAAALWQAIVDGADRVDRT